MSDNVVRLKVDSQEYDSKISRASKGLQALGQNLRNAGKTFADADKEAVVFARELGKMQTVSTSARGKVSELSSAFVNLKSDYLQMTEAEKRSPMGQAMAKSLEELKNRTIEAKHELESLNKEINGIKTPDVGSIVGKEGGGLFSGDKISGMLQVFGGNMMTKAAGWAAGFVSEIGDAVKQGIELAKAGEGVRIAFERLNQPGLLDNLREATHGTVTNLELMKAAVKFNDFKLPLDELGTMLAFAQQKAKDTGQSVDYMVDSIVTGLGRKSLMILDNLGLSANEVKEKMKETGDMTKAVGEIIREQMSKAGDYVETAADRAAQADVELKNAMEELGRTFQPLTDASDSLWNSIKVGALNALNTAVNPLIQALSEAGALGQSARATAGFGNLGGNSKVDRMIGRLGNGKTAGAYSIYQQQLGEFDKYINNKRFQIAAYGGDNSSIAQSAKAKLQTELDGALKMREEYVKRAQELHKQVPSPFEPASTSGGSGGGRGGSGGGGGGNDITYAEGSITAQTKLVQELTKQWNDASEEMKNGYLYQLVEAEQKLKEMKESDAFNKKGIELLYSMKNGEGASPAGIADGLTPDLKAIEEELAKNPIKLRVEIDPDKLKSIQKMAAIQKAAGDVAQVVGSIGDAFNAIEDPAAKVAGTVAQAIANIALGYSQAMLTPKDPISWIAFGATGLAQMLTTISAIHGATGYALGGEIKGNSYSGDNIPAMVDGSQMVGLNAGEVVLTKAMTNNLAAGIQGQGMGGWKLTTKLAGTDLLVSLERTLQKQGYGKLATWG